MISGHQVFLKEDFFSLKEQLNVDFTRMRNRRDYHFTERRQFNAETRKLRDVDLKKKIAHVDFTSTANLKDSLM